MASSPTSRTLARRPCPQWTDLRLPHVWACRDYVGRGSGARLHRLIKIGLGWAAGPVIFYDGFKTSWIKQSIMIF